jgi:antitoxin (DNA-binding transcriptional repressor) of toxin-antitoxin stability system
MTTISIDEVMRGLSGCLQKVEGGETFVIVQGGKPVAELKPISPMPTTSPRPFALCAGEFRVPDDFDAPLPEDILGQFEGA